MKLFKTVIYHNNFNARVEKGRFLGLKVWKVDCQYQAEN